jgi:hypothetical protein
LRSQSQTSWKPVIQLGVKLQYSYRLCDNHKNS